MGILRVWIFVVRVVFELEVELGEEEVSSLVGAKCGRDSVSICIVVSSSSSCGWSVGIESCGVVITIEGSGIISISVDCGSEKAVNGVPCGRSVSFANS